MHTLEQGRPLAEARTVAVNVFVMVETVYLFNCRSLTRPFWQLGIFSNPWLWGGIAIMLALQLLLTYWPPLAAIFQTAPITLGDWLKIVAFALVASLVVALEKFWSAFHVKPGQRSP
jgi:magnesium-transporting ATPase (P-type)